MAVGKPEAPAYATFRRAIWAAIALLFVFEGAAISKKGQQGVNMNQQDFMDKLAGANISSRDKMDSLLQTVRQGSYALPRRLLDLWLANDPQLAEKAEWILSRMDHLVLLPLLETREMPSADKKGLLLTILSEEHNQNHAYLLEKYRSFLKDTEEIPQPSGDTGPSEEPQFRKRVCDEAYLNICRLHNINQEEVDFITDSESYLHLPDEQRDEVIAHYLETGECRYEPAGGSEPTLAE